MHPYDGDGNVLEIYRDNTSKYPEISNGFISITSGAGGKLKTNWSPEPCPLKAASANKGHFSLFEIEGRTLKMKAISSTTGLILDSFEMNKK